MEQPTETLSWTDQPLELEADATWPAANVREAIDPLPTGARVGHRYGVSGLIAEGGLSRVYRAWDSVLRRQVAVKLYRFRLEQSVSREEIALQSHCQHPNLMPLYDAGTEAFSGVPFVVMPLYPGTDLGERLRQGPLGIRQALTCAEQLCSALECLWYRRRAIHGDVKSSNVWWTPDGTAVLMDFNLRGLLPLAPWAGTPSTRAPEALEGRRDRRSDVFSVGCVLYQMLTGILPYGEDAALAAGPPSPPSRLRPEVTAELDAIVLTALNLSPDARYPDAGALRRALRKPRSVIALGLARLRKRSPRARLTGPGLALGAALAGAALWAGFGSTAGWTILGAWLLALSVSFGHEGLYLSLLCPGARRGLPGLVLLTLFVGSASTTLWCLKSGRAPSHWCWAPGIVVWLAAVMSPTRRGSGHAAFGGQILLGTVLGGFLGLQPWASLPSVLSVLTCTRLLGLCTGVTVAVVTSAVRVWGALDASPQLWVLWTLTLASASALCARLSGMVWLLLSLLTWVVLAERISP